jgi:hypothetical protein
LQHAINNLDELDLARRTLRCRPVFAPRLLVVELLDSHPDPKLEAPAREVIHRGSGLGEGARKVQDRIRNQRPYPDRVGPQGHGSDNRQAIEPGERGIAGVSGVIRCEEEIEAQLLDMSPALEKRREWRIRKDQDAESQSQSG